MIELDQGPRPCYLEMHNDQEGVLYYRDPMGHDHNEALHVTKAPNGNVELRTEKGTAGTIRRWHIDILQDGTIVTNPSILLPGRWHIAPGARWTPTPANPDGSWPKTEAP